MDPPTVCFPNLLKKGAKWKKRSLNFGNFAIARPVCMHNMLSQRTAANFKTECKIINKKAEDFN